LTILKSKGRKKLERAGWRVGNATDFLALAPAEERYVETKLDFTSPKLTPAQQAELDRRLKAHARNPGNVVP
jgi:Putative addiction module component